MSITRRKFLAHTGAAAASVSASAVFSSRARAADTADIRVAVIGIRNQGNGHIGQLGANVVALCDVDEQVLAERADQFHEKHGRRPDTYIDFRKLLDRQDIDAVSIATPNHTHALITIAAVRAGKDVYVEKPASHNVWEGRQMVAAARRYNRIIQCGTQSRSNPDMRAAVKWVQDGNLGAIRYAIGTCFKPRKSIGQLTEPLKIPKTIDYDLWCGPAAKVDLFRPQLHYDWHWDFNTGNGDMGNQGIHQMDIARWFLGEDKLAPRTLSIGGRLGYRDAGDTPNTQVVYHDYAKAPLIFETRGLPRSKQAQENWGKSMDQFRGSGVGVIVQCEKGHVFVPSYREAIAYDLRGEQLKRWKGGTPHHANWLAAIAARDAGHLNAEIREGHVSSSLCHTGGVSHQLGEHATAGAIAEQVAANDLLSGAFARMAGHLRANGVDIDSEPGSLTLGPWLEVDPETETFVGNDDANELLTRDYRQPYTVPNVEGELTAAAAG